MFVDESRQGISCCVQLLIGPPGEVGMGLVEGADTVGGKEGETLLCAGQRHTGMLYSTVEV